MSEAEFIGLMAEEVSDPRHDALFLVMKRLPSDFAPWGERSREREPGPDRGGCRWLIPLEDWSTGDWGVCHNPKSPRAGTGNGPDGRSG